MSTEEDSSFFKIVLSAFIAVLLIIVFASSLLTLFGLAGLVAVKEKYLDILVKALLVEFGGAFIGGFWYYTKYVTRRALLKVFTPLQRKIVKLRFSGKKVDKIAHELQIEPAVVAGEFCKAMKLLDDFLGEELGE